MQGINFKFGERREDWRCCFCCHVRTATIFLGVWHLMFHVLTLSVIAVILRHPELVIEPTAPALPTPQSEYDNSYAPDVHANSSPNAYRKFLVRNNLEYQHLNVSIVVMFSTFAITLLMVYGAIKGKPSYLMPFFCLQLFDFCIASLTALSYLCYLPDMHRLVSESPKIPLQAELLTLSPQALAFIVLITFLTAMVVKAYFMGVVWSCYKYLTLRLVAAQRTIHLIEPDVQDLLPDYETACTKFPPPPPSYTQATQHHPPPPPPPPSSTNHHVSQA